MLLTLGVTVTFVGDIEKKKSNIRLGQKFTKDFTLQHDVKSGGRRCEVFNNFFVGLPGTCSPFT